ncbi:chemotaxis protein CheW [Corallincola platygyrae]|uniref:Chemotaxis protein CheW n=1 Tax=Corallincola platygyrae TaxID=1193278 RepID=A0ABW4XIA6_9GAMM
MKDYLSATERTMAEYFTAMLREEFDVDESAENSAELKSPKPEQAQPEQQSVQVQLTPETPEAAKHAVDNASAWDEKVEDGSDADIVPSQLTAAPRLTELPEAETGQLVRQAQPVEELLKQVSQHATTPTIPAVPEKAPVAEEINDWDPELLARENAEGEVEPYQPTEFAEPEPSSPTIGVNPELDGLKSLLAESGLEQLAETIIPPETPAKPIEDNEFQTLFFEVAGLTLAVPLKQLGGILPIERVHKLIGKPDWFKGVMNARGEKQNVVDTAMWVMPEKYNEELAEHLNYQYLIMLDSSPWGLAVENMVTAEPLSQDGIKWRTERSKRPWLAGMAVDRMCALLDVEQLISLLDKGLES